MSTVDVQRSSGMNNQTIGNFLKGSSLFFETGMRLLEWIEAQERAKADEQVASPKALDNLDNDHKPRAPEFAEARPRGQTDAKVANDVAVAAIDACKKPIKFRTPSSS